jgi:hypothetical protein
MTTDFNVASCQIDLSLTRQLGTQIGTPMLAKPSGDPIKPTR